MSSKFLFFSINLGQIFDQFGFQFVSLTGRGREDRTRRPDQDYLSRKWEIKVAIFIRLTAINFYTGTANSYLENN